MNNNTPQSHGKKSSRARDPRDPRRASQGSINLSPNIPQKRKASEDTPTSSSYSQDGKPRSILRASSDDHNNSREYGKRRSLSVNEDSVKDTKVAIFSKVAEKLQSSSTTSISVQLFSGFFLSFYRQHQETVMQAWHNVSFKVFGTFLYSIYTLGCIRLGKNDTRNL